MIRNIHTNEDYLVIHKGHNFANHGYSPGAQSAGLLRYNYNSSDVEVYNGMSWHTLGGDTSINFSKETVEVLEWARTKMQEEVKLRSLMAQHPGLKDLNDKFEMIKVLCQQEENKK
jgi:hypothetical protein